MSRAETRERIITTAMDLFSDKGYSSVKTKEIADMAGISEVTLFRYFNSKRELFSTAVSERMHEPVFSSLGHEQFCWELKQDLRLISHLLGETMEKNHQIIKMNMKDIKGLSEEDASFMNFPDRLKVMLIQYFDQYKARTGAEFDSELATIAFLSSIFGLAMNFYIVKAFKTSVTFNAAVTEIVNQFSRSLSSLKK